MWKPEGQLGDCDGEPLRPTSPWAIIIHLCLSAPGTGAVERGNRRSKLFSRAFIAAEVKRCLHHSLGSKSDLLGTSVWTKETHRGVRVTRQVPVAVLRLPIGGLRGHSEA